MPYRDEPDRTQPLPASLDPRGLRETDEHDRTRILPQHDYPAEPAGPRPGERPLAPPSPAPRRRPRRRRGLRIFSWLLALLVLAVIGFACYLDLSITREDALQDYDGRPADSPGTTWLLVGSDARDDLTQEQKDDLATGDAEGKRTDTIMLLHVPDSDAPPTLVSLPRDTLVELAGHGQQKLNAAFSIGGSRLLAQTVEGLTGLRVDRYAEIGFGGFAGVVDSIGGVEMCLDEPMKDPKAGLDLPAGCQTLDGPQALGYVRTRASANADLDRVERQREFLSALLSKASSAGTLLNPVRSIPLALKATGTLTVDDGCHLWHLASMGLAMGSGELDTTTVPIASTPTLDGVGSVVVWDDEAAAALFSALGRDEAVPQELLSGG